MKCPLKFSRYEFEGGEECIGAECGFYGSVCDMDMSLSVQKCPNELPEGDAVAIMSKAAKGFQGGTGNVMKNAKMLLDMNVERGLDSVLLETFADMVERDYVSRESIEGVMDTDRELVAENIRLRAERDEWKAKAEGSSKVRACTSKSAKRAAAVERLRQLEEHDGSDEIVTAMVPEGVTVNRTNWTVELDTIIDLLIDDDANDDSAPKDDVSATDADANDASVNLGSEPSTLEVFDGKGSEVDSREKLESEVRYEYNGSIENEAEQIIGWLDRQAAITERETTLRELYKFEKNHREHIDSIEEVNRELNRRIAELTEQLEAAHAKNRALKAHISKMQQGRHGWHVKGVELQRQVDELTAQLHASNAERARLRECLGIATDNAHDFLTLVDESGNVHDRDEGLA